MSLAAIDVRPNDGKKVLFGDTIEPNNPSIA
jgi:hypothetical protein